MTRSPHGEPARGTHLILVDAVLAMSVAAATAGIALSRAGSPPYSGPAWLAVVLAVLIGLPLGVRRRRPLPVLVVVLAASVAATPLGVTHDPYVAVALAIYTLAASAPPRRTAPALIVCWLFGAVVLAASSGNWELPALACAISGAAWILGRAVWQQRDHAAKLAEQHTRQVLTEERLHIARELHDIVAHNISLIAVKAAVANHVADTHPQEAVPTLRMIETTSRQTLDDLRRVLGVLRAEDEADDDETRPVPGLDDLPDLAEQVTRAGVQVDLDLRRTAEPPAAIALTAYRVVQEALTNVVKHANTDRCQVTVHADRNEVNITVTDRGRARRTGLSGGHGLIGIRERVDLHGGTCTAGPRETGGFEVSAHLPWQDSRTAAAT